MSRFRRQRIVCKNGSKIFLNVRETGFFSMGLGLMFKPKETEILVFDFKRSGRWAITSYFVFFDFLAVWLDEKDRIVECELIKPFRWKITPKTKITRLVEVPLNDGNRKIIDFFVGKQRKV